MIRSALLALVVAACGGCVAAPGASRPTYATATRKALVGETNLYGLVLDPALDCVARGIALGSSSQRALLELEVVCGTPLYVLDSRTVHPDEVDRALIELRGLIPPSVRFVAGMSRTIDGVTVVGAAKLVELQPFHPGDRTLRGRLLVNLGGIEAYVSTAGGVARRDVSRTGDAFELDVSDLRDADVELAIKDAHESGPLARVRLGAGSPLFAGAGSLLDRANAARAKLGLSQLRAAPSLGTCEHIEPLVAGADVTDVAHCRSFPRLPTADLAVAVAHSPLTQARLLLPRVGWLETGAGNDGAALRLLEPFEMLSPEAGRARVLAALRERWPHLVVHEAPPGQLDELLQRWIASGDFTQAQPSEAAGIDELAKGWSTTPHYATLLETARDLDRVLDDVHAETPPVAADVAFAQTRGPDGAMRHLVAVILAVP